LIADTTFIIDLLIRDRKAVKKADELE